MSDVTARFFGAPSMLGRAAALFSFITLLAFFMGPFYWPASNSAWAGFLRISTLVSVTLYILYKSNMPKRSGASVLLVIFLAYMILNSIFLEEGMQSARRIIFIGFFILMVANFWREPNLPIWLMATVTLIGAIFAGFSLINLYRLGELSFTYRTEAIFSSGLSGVADFGNTIVAAMHYAICFSAALWLLFNSRSGYIVVLWAACLFMIGTYTVMTFARTGWVACLAVFIILSVFALRSRNWRRVVPVLITVSVLLIWLSLTNLDYELSVRGVTYRDEIWITVLERFQSHPIFGHGAGKALEPISINNGTSYVRTAHSTYMEVLYQFGVTGLIMFFAVILAILNVLIKGPSKHQAASVRVWALAVFISGCVVMTVELNGFIDAPNLLWVWFWFPVGMALSYGGQQC